MVKTTYSLVGLIFLLLNSFDNSLYSQVDFQNDSIVYELKYKNGKAKERIYVPLIEIVKTKNKKVKFVYYHKNGKMESYFEEINHKKEGSEYRWYPNGQLKSWDLFKKGKWLGSRYCYANGKIQGEMVVDTFTNEEKHFRYDKKGRCTGYQTIKNYLRTGGRSFSSSENNVRTWGYFINGFGVDSVFYPKDKLFKVQYYNGFEKPDSIKYYAKDGSIEYIDRLVQEKSFTYTTEQYDHGKLIAKYYTEKNVRVKAEKLINGVWETEQYYYDKDGFMYRKTTSKGDEFFENKKKKKSK